MNKCPICQTATVDGALYCHMCGVSLKDAQRKLQESMRSGRLPLYRHAFTAFGEQKTVEVWCHDITTFPQDFDLLTVSAFPNNYNTTARSLIGALWRNLGINVGELLTDPFIDLRPQIGCWLSRPLPASSTGGLFTHIGCITLGGSEIGKGSIISRIRSYFHMLDLAADADVPMETILVPLIGTGDQNIQADQILLPLMNEVVSLLKRNNKVKKLLFVERNYEKASMAADALRKSYQLSYAPAENTAKPLNKEPYFFLSYTTHGDTYAAELFRDELRRRGLRYWYAPDSIRSGDYASQIVEGSAQAITPPKSSKEFASAHTLSASSAGTHPTPTMWSMNWIWLSTALAKASASSPSCSKATIRAIPCPTTSLACSGAWAIPIPCRSESANSSTKSCPRPPFDL